MREIKFSYIYQHDDTGRISNKIFDIHEIELKLMGECFIERYTLITRRQYTGLKDKNGVEIYEGDIVVYDDTPYNAHTSILTGIIKMENLSFKLISIKPDSLGYRKMLIGNDDFFNIKSKVIGNIYENPELLKELK